MIVFHVSLATHETVEGDFTAEFNLAFRSDSGKAGALFCYADARNWGRVSIEPASGQMEIATCLDGEIAAKSVPIPRIVPVRSGRTNGPFIYRFG